MKNLSKPLNNPTFLQHLVLIRDAKTSARQRQDLIDNHDRIVARYDRFEAGADGGSLHTLRPSPTLSQIAMTLRSCYAPKTVAFRSLKKSIVDAQSVRFLKYCPMCGITSPATNDHYMPASRFPEFSVHPLNLVPCCSTCNSTKDDDWLGVDGKRSYLHLYTDILPADAFLSISLVTLPLARGFGATFSISRPNRFSKVAWSLIESHFKKLSLLRRYTEAGNDEISEILEDCRIHQQEGGTRPRRFLRARADARALIYGESHWRVALMREIASSPRFFDLVRA